MHRSTAPGLPQPFARTTPPPQTATKSAAVSSAVPSHKTKRLDEVFEDLMKRLLYPPRQPQQGKSKDLKKSGATTSNKNGNVKGYQLLGLDSPIWWWTHRVTPTTTPAATSKPGIPPPPGSRFGASPPPPPQQLDSTPLIAREAAMVHHLLEWIHHNEGVQDMSTVHVLTTPSILNELKAKCTAAQGEGQQGEANDVVKPFGATVLTMPQFAVQLKKQRDFEAEQKAAAAVPAATPTPPHADAPGAVGSPNRTAALPQPLGHVPLIAICAMGTPSSHANVVALSDKEDLFASFFERAQRAAIVVSDGGWLHPKVPWQSLRTVRATKLGDVTLRCYDGLFGNHLPVCCPRHSDVSFSATAGVESIGGFCRRLCLKPYQCGTAEHLCTKQCHTAKSGNHSAASCPYACARTMPCGHSCKQPCGQPCNCLVVTQEPLPCSHKQLTGYDNDRKEPIYTEIPHQFEGVCRDQDYPCSVEVQTTCDGCLKMRRVPCAVLGTGMTDEASKLCEDCTRIKFNLRQQTRFELLENAKKEKERRAAEAVSALARQTQAAKKGIFMKGQRLLIRNNDAVISYLGEDAFPNVPADDWLETDGVDLEGMQGVVCGRHIDDSDTSEMVYLLKLDSGKYVTIGDSSLSLMRALTTGGSLAATAPLLITAGEKGQSSGAATTEGGEGATAATAPAAPLVYDHLPALGTLMLLTEPVMVPCPWDDGATDMRLNHIAVEVVGHASSDSLRVEIHRPMTLAASKSKVKDDADNESAAKKARTEDGSATASKDVSRQPSEAPSAATPQMTAESWTTIVVDVPAHAVQPLFPPGQQLTVSDPTSQAVALADKQALTSLDLKACPSSFIHSLLDGCQPPQDQLTHAHVYPTRVKPEESCRVVGVINAPCPEAGMSLSTPGPYYLLQPQSNVEQIHRKMQENAANGSAAAGQKTMRGGGHQAGGVTPTIIIVSVTAVSRDEAFEAELELDRHVLDELDTLTKERFEEAVRDTRFKNEEMMQRKLNMLARHQKKTAGAVTAVKSVPVPLPSSADVAAAESAYSTRAHAMTVEHNNAKQHDAATAKDLAYKRSEVQARLSQQHEKEHANNDGFFESRVAAPQPSMPARRY